MGYQTVRALTPIRHSGVLRVPGQTTGDNAQDFVVEDSQASRLVTLGYATSLGAAPAPFVPGQSAGSGAVYYPRGLTYGAIMDAFNEIVASGKPGTIQYAPDAYDISSAGLAVPWHTLVSHQGVQPITSPTTSAPDIGAALNQGTVFIGNGAFAGISQGLADTALPPNTQVGAITGAFIRNIGFKNFTNAIRTGSDPVNYGTFNALIEGVYAFDCTQESFVFNNFQHTRFRKLYDSNCAHGPLWTGNGGNSSIIDVMSSAAQQNKLSRGIRITSPHPTGWLNFITCMYMQRNAFGRAADAMSATFTAGNPLVRVAFGEKLAVGAPVMFSAAVGNIGVATPWIVRSIAFVSGTTGPADITLGYDTYRSTVTTPNASGSITLTFYGMPHFEVIKGANGSATSAGGVTYTGFNQSAILVNGLDLEGLATSAISMEYAAAEIEGCELALSGAAPLTPSIRLVGASLSYGNAEVSVSADGSSNFRVAPGTGIKKIFFKGPTGQYVDTSSGSSACLSLARDSDGTPHLQMIYGGGKWHAYAARSIGQKTTYNSTANLLGYQLAYGDNHYQGGAAATWVFPDAPGNNDNLGAECNIYNDSGTATMTVNVNAGQNPLGNVPGRTQVTLAPGQSIRTKFAWRAGQPLGYLSVLSSTGTFNT